MCLLLQMSLCRQLIAMGASVSGCWNVFDGLLDCYHYFLLMPCHIYFLESSLQECCCFLSSTSALV